MLSCNALGLTANIPAAPSSNPGMVGTNRQLQLRDCARNASKARFVDKSVWRNVLCALATVLVLLSGIVGSPVAIAASVTPTYDTNCAGGCHGGGDAVGAPAGGRINAAGAAAVIASANTLHSMSVGGLSGLFATIATELATFFNIAAQSLVNVPYQGSKAITITSLVNDAPGAVITTTKAGTLAPTQGFITTGTAGSFGVTYNHTGTSCTDSFDVKGTGGADTADRRVNVTIDPPTLTATNSSPAIAYNNAAFTNIPLTTTGTFTGATITTGLNPNVGTLQVVGTNIQYRASAATYASSVTFSYRTTGPCSSQSNIATVTLSVGLPPAPSSSNTNNAPGVAFNSPQTAQAIVLPVTGIFTQVNVTGATSGTAPTPAAGVSTVTFTPTSGFVGAGSFTYTVTGPGGTSGTFTATVNVAAPPAPTAGNRAVNTNFNTAAVIDLTPNITGFVSSVAVVGGSVTNGTTSVAGNIVTFTPTNGYFGPATFQYTATAPGGAVSAPGTVSITVGLPPAPGVSNVNQNVAFQTATAVVLPVTGTFNQVTVVTGPTNGTAPTPGAGVSTVTYTPNAGYIGTDSFTYQATAPGGNTSVTATVSITVQAPGAPTAGNQNVATAFNTAAAINLATSVTGAFISVAVVGGSVTNGTATIVGNVVTFTPTPGYIGPATFQYTATAPGNAVSAPGTVSITVQAPGAPTVTNQAANTPFNTAVAVNLTGNITGPVASIAVVGGSVTNGTATVAGNVVTFTPTTGYIGPATFQYTATAPGGAVSTAATVSITVQAPGAPTVTNQAANTPFNTAVAVNLTGNITGPVASIAVVGGSVTNGTATVAGNVVTFTPTTGYIGPATFQYTATAPGGAVSTAATVSITVQAPGAPTVTNQAANTAFNTAVAVNLTGNITGPVASIAVVGGSVTNGTAAVAGTVITFTPTTGYIGPATFQYTATAPGGAVSTAATVSITVTAPNAPTVTARAVNTAFNTPAAINLAANITGAVASIAVVGGSVTNGTTAVAGTVVTFTPTSGFSNGTGTFQYTATAPGGAVSTAATVSITVATLAPSASAAAMTVPLNTAGTLDLAPFITGSAVTGVQIATAPRKGTATVSGTRVIYTPATDSFEPDTFTYQAIGNAGTSAPATVTVTVVGRQDPTKNTNAIGLLGAQADSSVRFAQGQSRNIGARLESLRRSSTARNTSSTAGANAVARSATPAGAGQAAFVNRDNPGLDNQRNGIANSDAIPATNADRNAAAVAVANEPPVRLAALGNPGAVTDSMGAGLSLPSFVSDLVSVAKSRSINVAQLTGSGRGAEGATAGSREISYWMDGTVSFGSRDATGTRGALDFTTSGVTAGVDYRVTDRLVLGVSVGYARDRTNIGTDGTRNRSQGYSVAAYGSYQPTANTFIDGLLGAGSLRFDMERFVPSANSFALANRDGSQMFAALIGGYEYRRNGTLWSPYGRVDYSVNKLDQATESGAGANALTYFAQRQKALQGALGLRVESAHEASFGWVVPRLRGEYRYDAQGEQQVSISYADQVGTGPRYTLGTGPLDRSTAVFGVGSDFILRNGVTLGVDYQLNYSSAQSRSQTVRLKLQFDLDGKPRKPGFLDLGGEPGPLDLQFDGGYTFDDNVNRASNRSERLLDHSFSANVSKNWMFPIAENDNVRALATAILGGEKFKNYIGLSRASVGVTGELQYRPSAEFSAPTLALFGKTFLERFESDSRDGYRYSVGVSATQTLTDRITVFGALAHDERYGKSAVFDGKHNSARMNLDYALHTDGTLYMGGEYRRGDTVSTALPTLANLDIAKVFRADDVFGKGLTSYRVDAKTWIGTVGYNLGFGPRNSLDISYRRAQSLTLQSPSFAAPGFKYVVNQFNLVYLMRF